MPVVSLAGSWPEALAKHVSISTAQAVHCVVPEEERHASSIVTFFIFIGPEGWPGRAIRRSGSYVFTVGITGRLSITARSGCVNGQARANVTSAVCETVYGPRGNMPLVTRRISKDGRTCLIGILASLRLLVDMVVSTFLRKAITYIA